MKYYVKNEFTNNKEVLVERNAWSGKTNIYYNGQLLRKITRKLYEYQPGRSNDYLDNDSRPIRVSLKGSEIFGLELSWDGKPITIIRKLTVLEIILSVIPLIMVAFGGAIGGLLGALGMMVIASFCRKMDYIIVKILFALGIYTAVFICWATIAGEISKLI